ncbi:MAG: hypothetical protein KDA41_22015, partial [Planctomycetales bacterium]|nr:hypothetical protein [Planctomycetales bacterium]
GRGEPAADASVTLRLKRGEEEKTISQTLDRRVDSEFAPRLYGQVAVGQLEDLMHATEEVSISYARHFRITGQTCSLLMLETEEDYARFNVKPEEDVFVVKSTPAAALIQAELAKVGDRLDDSKAALLHFLSQLEQVQAAGYKTPKALSIAIDAMPAEAFETHAEPLKAMTQTRSDVGEDYSAVLAAAELDYDAVVAEAERRLKQHGASDAIKALSSLVERNPGDVALARDVAMSAADWGLPGHAAPILRRVANARPYEPQTYQALGKTLAEAGNADLAIVYYEVLMAANWNGRYGEIRKVAGVEYLHLLNRIAAGDVKTSVADFAAARRDTLAAEMNVTGAKLVVTMLWNTDRTDIDMHVFEPSGEE